jgi:large subunit ribosomal protein L22
MKHQEKNTIIARASHATVTPRKANLVLESLIGLHPEEALDRLKLTTKRASHPISKLIKQALGNAADQQKVAADQLIIKRAFATKGRVLKFVRFAGRGRIKPYQKVASHLTIILKIKNNTLLKKTTAKKAPQVTRSKTKPSTNEKPSINKKIKNKK